MLFKKPPLMACLGWFHMAIASPVTARESSTRLRETTYLLSLLAVKGALLRMLTI